MLALRNSPVNPHLIAPATAQIQMNAMLRARSSASAPLRARCARRLAVSRWSAVPPAAQRAAVGITTTTIVRITIALPSATGRSVRPKRADRGECEEPRLRVQELKRGRLVEAQRPGDLGSLDGGAAGEPEREEEQVQGSDELESELDLGEPR